jgi:hypothetical protein
LRGVLQQEVVGNVELAIGPATGNVGGLFTWTSTGVYASLTVIPGGSGSKGESPPTAAAGVGVLAGD